MKTKTEKMDEAIRRVWKAQDRAAKALDAVRKAAATAEMAAAEVNKTAWTVTAMRDVADRAATMSRYMKGCV